jgi:hypothetical protein
VAADRRNLTRKAAITDISAEVEDDQQESVMKLAWAHDVSAKRVHVILHKNLQLSKKSARWGTKMLYKETKKERLRSCEAVSKMITHCSFLTLLDNFITVGESAGNEEQTGRLILTQEAS